jgi:hypothetical protein
VKVGDLVVPTHDPRKSDGYMGVIVGYDKDDDPIVLWNKHDPEDVYEEWTGCYALPEYRSSVEVIQ